ncbi:MAG: HutD family protein [Lysobacteraceae bacterium]
MRLRLLPAADYVRARWRNQAGWTREIAVEHAADERLLWRASIADIDEACEYSPWPGLHRHHRLLSGNGLRLRFADGREQALLPPHQGIAFDGDAAPRCDLLDGPVTAFNLMHDPERMSAKVLHRPLVGTLTLFPDERETWLIYLIAGSLRGDTVALAQGDSLIIDQAIAGNRRLLLDGAGEALLIRLVERASPDAAP